MPQRDALESSSTLVLHAARLIRIVRRYGHQLPGASVRLLSLVDQHASATIKDLSAADQCSQPTMTGLVNGLVERGWLQREPNPVDARSWLISLTTAGKDELRQAREHNAELIKQRAALAGISDDDLALAASVIERLTNQTRPTPQLNRTEQNRKREFPC